MSATQGITTVTQMHSATTNLDPSPVPVEPDTLETGSPVMVKPLVCYIFTLQQQQMFVLRRGQLKFAWFA